MVSACRDVLLHVTSCQTREPHLNCKWSSEKSPSLNFGGVGTATGRLFQPTHPAFRGKKIPFPPLKVPSQSIPALFLGVALSVHTCSPQQAAAVPLTGLQSTKLSLAVPLTQLDAGLEVGGPLRQILHLDVCLQAVGCKTARAWWVAVSTKKTLYSSQRATVKSCNVK